MLYFGSIYGLKIYLEWNYSGVWTWLLTSYYFEYYERILYEKEISLHFNIPLAAWNLIHQSYPLSDAIVLRKFVG